MWIDILEMDGDGVIWREMEGDGWRFMEMG